MKSEKVVEEKHGSPLSCPHSNYFEHVMIYFILDGP